MISMFAFDRRMFSATLLLLALVAPAVGCGRTSHDDGQPPSQSGGTAPTTPAAGATAAGASAGGNQAGSAAASGGTSSDVSSAGASEIDPSTTSRPCQE